jgi:SAM-dependent methyltransferase
MPTSDPANISPIINNILRLAPLPRRVLDIGVGFGKYGALLREYLDIGMFRIEPEQWATVINGVEGFEKYMNPLWDVYNQVFIEDFRTHFKNYVGYDLVLMIDSLEHVERPLGDEILDYLTHKNKNVIVSIPDGDFPQGAVNGNEMETHRARWYQGDFTIRGGRIIHSGVCAVAHFKGRK